ncbi:MAG: alpha/beta fold hydrolase [Patescibacteria group bacterium]
MPEKIKLTTSDQIEIIGDYYLSEGNKFAILLHMMPATKESWVEFAPKLVEKGYTCLAIDERGHGESTMNGTLDYQNFSEEQQQAKILDVQATFEYLKEKGATLSETILIGGSIGANLSIQFLQNNPEIKKAVALSPGLNYRGLQTEPLIQTLAPHQKVLLIASDDDTHTSYESVIRLHELNPAQTTLVKESGIGHATDMLVNKPELMGAVIDWIEST